MIENNRVGGKDMNTHEPVEEILDVRHWRVTCKDCEFWAETNSVKTKDRVMKFHGHQHIDAEHV